MPAGTRIHNPVHDGKTSATGTRVTRTGPAASVGIPNAMCIDPEPRKTSADQPGRGETPTRRHRVGLTRPQAIIRRMDAAAHGLRGAIRNVARMLAIIDYEHEEDQRLFGYSRSPPPAYVNLREAARGAVEEAGAPTAPAGSNRPASRAETPLAARWPTPATINRHDHRVQELRRRTDGDLPEPGLRRPGPLLLGPRRTLRRTGDRHRSVAERRTHPAPPDRAGRQLLARLRTPPAPEPLGAAGEPARERLRAPRSERPASRRPDARDIGRTAADSRR